MRCSKCAVENREGRKFCAECGALLKIRCQSCLADNEPTEKFCGDCGAALNAGSAPASETSKVPHSNAAGERRHLTILFCDLVGSVTLTAQLDPEEWRATVAGYQRAAAEAITRFGGEVVRYVGDGIMAFFGYPVAHDNDAERAARAGLAILEAIAQLNEQPAHVKLAVRIGIDSGRVVVGAGAGNAVDAFGDTANIAARVQAAAESDTVVVTGETHRLISGLFVVEERGAPALKGIERPVQLYRVVRPSGMQGRFKAAAAAGGLTRFVGRDDELRTLLSRWARAVEGEGQVVTIIGEPGIGKSRLVQEFRERIAGERHTWLEGSTAAFFQNTPFYATAEMLRQSFNWHSNQNHERRLAALEASLKATGVEIEGAVPLIAALLELPLGDNYSPLSMPPDQQRKRLLATLVAWTMGAAKAQPLVIATEDLHWADPSTLEVTQLLVEQGATVPLMLIYTARPEFRAPWSMRAHHTQLTLNRLGARDIRTIVAQVAAQKALSDETIAAVVERTGGVPLFVEELTRAVLESGDGKLSGRDIPATLHDSLMARLDRLGAAKEVAQVGAVLGREFSYALLHAVHRVPESELQAALSELAEAELLYVQGLAPNAHYQFKHALIRDAAYEALLKSRRRELHLIVARTIDEQFPSLKETHPEVIARHWTEAGEAEQAITAWQKAGERAAARGALVEAESHYVRALGLVAGLPQDPERDRLELGLQVGLGLALWGAKGWAHAATHRAFARGQQLAENLGDTQQLILVLHGLAVSASVNGRVRIGQELAEREVLMAEVSKDRGLLCAANFILGNSLAFRARFRDAQKRYTLAKGYFDETDVQRLPVNGANYAAMDALVTLELGFPDLARRQINEALRIAERLKSSFPLAFAQMCACTLFMRLRDAQTLLEQVDELRRRTDEYPFFSGYVEFYAGSALLIQGKIAEGIERMRRATTFWEPIGFRMTRALEIAAEAQLCASEGRVDDALALMSEALRETEEFLWRRTQILRLRADLLAERGTDEAEIEAGYREAVQFASGCEARFEQLQCTARFARWLKMQGRVVEAREMLAEIYNWFTEGFDTLDLKDAKALLDELSVSGAAR
ncbi:MAG TPA: AAA family ATPase [Candidatus Binataceae bacterium]|nr:AAA family ATPase [Candidatus Binataceae bacterium]